MHISFGVNSNDILFLVFFFLYYLKWERSESCQAYTLIISSPSLIAHLVSCIDAYRQESDTEGPDYGSCLGTYLRSSSVIPPIPIGITREEKRLARAFSGKLARLGVEVIFKRKGKDQQAQVRRVPACLVEREANMVRKAKQPIATDLAEVSRPLHILCLMVVSAVRVMYTSVIDVASMLFNITLLPSVLFVTC